MMPDGGPLARARATGDTARMAEDRTPTGLPCTHAWAVATGGALDLGARRAVTRAALGEAARLPLDLLRARLGRRPDGPMRLPSAPADELVEAALAASAGQGPAVECHGLRTWLFASLLASVDGVVVDPELLCVGGIAHDAGLAEAVPGEDFTLRSAAAAVQAFRDAGVALSPARADRLRDAVVAHATPGVGLGDSAEGRYLREGAGLDLVGLRVADLPAGVVEAVHEAHPSTGLRHAITRAVAAEARANPDGRFAVMTRLGFVPILHARLAGRR